MADNIHICKCGKHKMKVKGILRCEDCDHKYFEDVSPAVLEMMRNPLPPPDAKPTRTQILLEKAQAER